MKIQSGNIQNYTAESEHAIVNGIEVKKVVNVDVFGNIGGGNPSTALSYDVNGDLQYIDETIGTTTYRTTLTYTDRVLTGISEAVEL